MASTLRRRAAFLALWRALALGARGGPSLGRRLRALPRMLTATMRGGYDGGARLGLMALGILYVIWPFDLVPEAFLPIVGLADDAVVVTWLAGAVLAETERFLEWERHWSAVIDGRHMGIARRRR